MDAVQVPSDALGVGGKFLHKWYMERSGAKATFTVIAATRERRWTEVVNEAAEVRVVEHSEPLPREKWRFSVQADEPTFATFKSGFVLPGLTADEFDGMVESLL